VANKNYLAASPLMTGNGVTISPPVSGTGDLSSWPDARGSTGIAAADEICRTRAAAAGLENSLAYIATVRQHS